MPSAYSMSLGLFATAFEVRNSSLWIIPKCSDIFMSNNLKHWQNGAWVMHVNLMLVVGVFYVQCGAVFEYSG